MFNLRPNYSLQIIPSWEEAGAKRSEAEQLGSPFGFPLKPLSNWEANQSTLERG